MRLYRPCSLVSWLYPEAIFRIRTVDKVLYLTFDDGPDPESTPHILSLLDKYGIKAIFFCNGLAAQKYPALIDDIKLKGHVVGNHGHSHYDGWKTSDIVYCDDIKRASEFTSGTLFRPPYGHLTLRQYHVLKKSFRIVFWDIMPYDFDSKLGYKQSLAILKRKTRKGSVIVLHDKPGSSAGKILEDFSGSSISMGYRFELLRFN
jgi:peptidoglycan/xylan/chitin deacetylase (PgdA/CDA1 family)